MLEFKRKDQEIQKEAIFFNCAHFIYYVYMVSFALSRYRIWITSGLFLNVIC